MGNTGRESVTPNGRFRFNWDSGVLLVDGSFETKLRAVSSNQKVMLWVAAMDSGDWVKSPFMDGRDEDNVRSATTKTATRLNRLLKTVRIVTRDYGKEIRLEDRP